MFGKFIFCPYCGGYRVIINTDISSSIYRYKCIDCGRAFNTLTY